MHALVMRCLLAPGTKPSGMPLPRRLLRCGRRLRPRRPSTASPFPDQTSTRRKRHFCDRGSNMTRRGGLTAIDGAIALIAILLIIQMWLLTATLESHLAGHPEPILPAALISGILFCACGGLFLFISRLDA